MSRTLIMSHARVRRTVLRLAHEIVERNRGATEITVFGIVRRGVWLAHSLGEAIGEIEDCEVSVHPLDVTPFRDDLDEPIEPTPLDPPPSVEGRHLILVDDVLFTGRTARAAIDAVLAYGRPASIQLAVLVDRGHREYPIRPDYTGHMTPTKHRERVVVDVDDDGALVYLEE